jgi:predicted  nucleic acid-binding Zn-ribbon protein
MNDANTKPVLTGHIYEAGSFADANASGSIDLGHYTSTNEEDYHMAIKAVEIPKTKAQVYYEEVEELKTGGMSNADAIREVAKKHGAKENAVRGGIFQYNKKLQGNGGTPSTSRRSSARRSAPATVDDYLAQARTSVESAIAALDQEVSNAEAAVTAAKEALAAAEAHRDQVVASVSDRKTDLQKKLDALS